MNEGGDGKCIDVVALGQTLRSIYSQAGLQLLNVTLTLPPIVHSTTIQTTAECVK